MIWTANIICKTQNAPARATYTELGSAKKKKSRHGLHSARSSEAKKITAVIDREVRDGVISIEIWRSLEVQTRVKLIAYADQRSLDQYSIKISKKISKKICRCKTDGNSQGIQSRASDGKH